MIQTVKQNPQKLNQSPSNFHIKGKSIDWSQEEKERFWKNELLNSMREIEPAFIVNERNRTIMAALYDYVWKKSEVLDSSKGLLLWGPLGVGKSVLLRGLQRYYGKINRYRFGSNNSGLGFKFISAVEIALIYAEKGMSGIAQYTDRECMCSLAIDELGREPTAAKHFGTGINVVQTILQLRYEVRREFITHATTNLDPNTQFAGVYGDYIADRVKEMFNVIEITGKSRR